MLEVEIRRLRQQKPILLMTHIVLGYPSFESTLRIVEQMVEAGVDLMELQIPFSEPMADGPVILHANQRALAAGSTVERCLTMASELCQRFPIPFLFMTYFNVPFVRGVERFAAEMQQVGVRGAIIPDLPHEEGDEAFAAMTARNLDPILLFSPSTTDARMREIGARGRGFIYCVARKGVTGASTEFGSVDAYLHRCRAATDLPLALGFGVKTAADVAAVSGRVDIAVVGSETIRVIDRDGVNAVAPFIRGLRPAA